MEQALMESRKSKNPDDVLESLMGEIAT